MSETRSTEYQRFMASVAGQGGGFESLRSFDLAALDGIRDDEKKLAVDLLRRHARARDPRVVSALLTLGTEEAWDVLLELLGGAPSTTVATAAHRVWERRSAPEAMAALEACLEAMDSDVRALAMRIVGRVDMPLLDRVKRGLTVRATEKLVNEHLNPEKGRVVKPGRSNQLSAALSEVQEQLRERLATQVQIHHGTKKGRIEIEYYSNEDLARLLDLMGVS